MRGRRRELGVGQTRAKPVVDALYREEESSVGGEVDGWRRGEEQRLVVRLQEEEDRGGGRPGPDGGQGGDRRGPQEQRAPQVRALNIASAC